MIKPIELNNKYYYNRTQLSKLGLTKLEIDNYFNLNVKIIVTTNGYISKLVLVEDYDNYIKFKNNNKKLFKY